jgi:aryl-alcohol dehydrogenase-like predicted oxidoreductase
LFPSVRLAKAFLRERLARMRNSTNPTFGALFPDLLPRLLLGQKPWIVPIPGTTKLSRLEENIGAANVELAGSDLGRVNAALANIKVEGERYPEELEKRTGL